MIFDTDNADFYEIEMVQDREFDGGRRNAVLIGYASTLDKAQEWFAEVTTSPDMPEQPIDWSLEETDGSGLGRRWESSVVKISIGSDFAVYGRVTRHYLGR
jgi:hypothetical protein